MVVPLGKTQLMEKETGKCNNTGAAIGTSSEDLAVPETIPSRIRTNPPVRKCPLGHPRSFNYPSCISE